MGCPIKGVLCKDLGENHFLFTFMHAAGKKRALEEEPWTFGKDLVVMVDFDESKTIEELVFSFIPIWIQVMKFPLGMMRRAMSEAIGNEIGSFVAMDLDENGMVVGRFLRIKVKLDIRRGVSRVCMGGR
jgi:hypothetical protein